jgi:hypothetical protein
VARELAVDLLTPELCVLCAREAPQGEKAMNTAGIVFNISNKRLGRLHLSLLGFRRMHEHKLTPEIIEEAFRYGKEIEPHKIVCNFRDYSVGILYARDERFVFRGDLSAIRFVIITCWKGVNRA